MTATSRRTQQARREATIAKLLDATIECLISFGYRDTSIGRICDRAGISHGGLFRHFPSRTALLAATTDEIGRRSLAQIQTVVTAPEDNPNLVADMVALCRDVTRSTLTSAWREVLIAARTNSDLCAAIEPALRFFEDAVMDLASQLVEGEDATKQLGTLILSILHMYDSEATTISVFETPYIEEIRFDWAVRQLEDFLALHAGGT
jgi:AcrR family transcriptional regulator